MSDLVFISSDPGVTNALIPVARYLYHQQARIHVIASGPAVDLWGQVQGMWTLDASDDEIDRDKMRVSLSQMSPDVVITGAGAYNMIEHHARWCADLLRIPSFALLDYWAHYPERFRRKVKGVIETILPDKIGVMDDLAYREMVGEGFLPGKLTVVGAPHLEEAVEKIKAIDDRAIAGLKQSLGLKQNVPTFVFFSQTVLAPESGIKEDRLGLYETPPLGFTQRTTLREILKALSDISDEIKQDVQLVIKSHPREPMPLSLVIEDVEQGAYVSVRIIDDVGVVPLIALSDMVLSLSSTALLESALSGKISLSVQIERNFNDFPDIFYGNRLGLTTSVTDRLVLRDWMRRVVLGMASKMSRSSIDFSGSAVRAGQEILGMVV